MKIVIIVIISLFISCAPTMPKKIEAGQVSEQNKLNAFNFAKRQFESCKTGKYIPLTTSNSSATLVKSLTIQEMKNACEKINKDCGDLQQLKLQEILMYDGDYIYRYKARYSATTREPEIQVYTDRNHKFNGIIYKPNWIDEYTPFNPSR
jgi:hypothetical protein